MDRPDEATTEAVESCRDALPQTAGGGRVVFGFDGYIDRVREFVSERQSADEYERVSTLAEFSERVHASVEAESSLSFEWIQEGVRTGGHVSHLARAFGEMGFDPALVGCLGDPPEDPFVDEFGDFPMETLGSPGYTDAVEFSDGKLMLTEIGVQIRLDWETIDSQVGVDRLAELVDGTELFGMGYWSEMPELPDVARGIREELWPTLSDPPETLLLDPGDLRKREPDIVADGIAQVSALDDVVDVVVSANRYETRYLAQLAGRDEATFEQESRTAFDHLDVTRFVGHGIDAAYLVDDDGVEHVGVPRTANPVLTTSSGDHFNAGLALAHVLGLGRAESLVVGNAVAGYFVRNGTPPTYQNVREFVEQYLDYFDAA
ncbi:PfkB family carbohydrate kinase [Haloferax sp. DFSO52]|uniref:PfkB family carbohydrate kinase n=1 Tax=Haloferax sp. DFSO52 TaxID=3388505 RepID=UPI003A84D84C